MTAHQVLLALRSKGVKLWVDNGRLRYQAARGTLTSTEIDALRALRDEILAFLQQSPATTEEIRLAPRSPSDRVPLAFSQLYLWDALNLDERPSMRTVAAGVRLSGRLDIDVLRRSFATLFQRHESLRTRVIVVDGAPRQHIDELNGEYPLEIFDLTHLPNPERELEARRLARQLAEEPVFLGKGPLFGVRVLKLGNREHVLIVAADHAVSDAASIGIVWREIFTAYSHFVRGQSCSLPEVPVQFADFAVWQQKNHSLWMEQHGAYWTRRLAGARRVRLFANRRLSSQLQWATQPVEFGQILTAGLLQVSRRERTSLVMSVLTAFVALVSRWCDVADLVLPFTTLGRFQPEVENTIGFFGTPLLLRIELQEEDTFLDLLTRVTREYATAYAHDDSCRVAVQTRRPEFTFNPPFNWIPGEFKWQPGESRHEFPTDNYFTLARFDFEITPYDDYNWDGEPRIDFSDTPDGVIGVIGYRADRFARDTVATFGRSLRMVAEKLVNEPHALVKSVGFEPCCAQSAAPADSSPSTETSRCEGRCGSW